MLLMLPLPHGSAEPMDQDDRRAVTDVEVRNPLILDKHGLDRDGLERWPFERFKIGRNL